MDLINLSYDIRKIASSSFYIDTPIDVEKWI